MKNSDFGTDLILEILVFLVWREDHCKRREMSGGGVGFSTSPEWQPWNYLNSYKRTQN